MNNPLRYTDPTGHWTDEGCGSGDTHCDNLPPPTNDKNNKDNRPKVPSNVPCGGLLTCKPSPYDFIKEHFTSSDACYFLNLPQYMCSADLWSTAGGDIENLSSNVDALGIRVEGSGWLFGGSDLNIDLMYFGRSNQMDLFVSPGGQAGTGGGGSITGGILIGNNMPGSGSYSGISYTVAGTNVPTPLGVNVEVEHSVSSANANGTIPTTTYVGIGPLQPEGGIYSGANSSISLSGLWGWLTGQ